MSGLVYAEPFVTDSNFVVEKFVDNLDKPITMAFIENDILVLEKNTGNVRLIKDGNLQPDYVLHVDVDYNFENGLLGITTHGSTVYLYFTASEIHGGDAIANLIYKYDWDGNNLQNGVLVAELPVNNEVDRHNGGAMETGLDGTIYAVIGDNGRRGVLQNIEDGDFYGTGVILRVDESVIKPHETQNPQDYYLGMGIRNSFGIAIDPITGDLWDTENGENDLDEINFVGSKFNSGWAKIMGPSTEEQRKRIPDFFDFEYSDPEFSWVRTVAPTEITFVKSESFADYLDYALVGGFNSGTIYKFKLNSDRTGFTFIDKDLQDLVLHPEDKNDEIIFGSGFIGVTDLEFGTDGFLYVVSIADGSIYRIKPTLDSISIREKDVPIWVKNIALWWHDDLIRDIDFLNSIQYLINKSIMKIPLTTISSNQLIDVPIEIKEKAGKWSKGQISDDNFISAVELLVAGRLVEINYQWCNENPRRGIDLSGCDLSNKNFSGKDLSFAKIKNSNLRGINILNTKMISVDFSGSDLSNSIIKKSPLLGSKFENANLIETKFENSDLTSSIFRNAFVNHSTFYKTVLLATDFQNSTITFSDLSYVDLGDSNFINANLTGSKFTKAKLNNALFNYATLSSADLSDTFLLRASFEGANLNNANLQNANLKKVIFNNASLSNAKLSNSYGIWIFFTDANLEGADLRNTNFENVNLSGSDLTNASFVGANLPNANLKGAILKNTDFKNANLTNADLENAVIENTNFDGTITKGCKGCP